MGTTQGSQVSSYLSILNTTGHCDHMRHGDALSLLLFSSGTQQEQGLACPAVADLAVGTPARGDIPLPGQGLGHLIDHELDDELLVFVLVVTNERHGGAHHLGEKTPSEERGGSACAGYSD